MYEEQDVCKWLSDVRCRLQLTGIAHRRDACCKGPPTLQDAPTRSKILGQNSFHPDPFITKFLKDDQHYLTIFSVEKINVLVTILVLR